MTLYLWIAAGGALGSIARAFCSIWALRLTGPGFPWGTIAVNILGSFVIGVLTVALGPAFRAPGAAEARAFLIIGVCGGFTTFSSFSLQTVELVRQGRAAPAVGNVALSVAACLAATALGMAVAANVGRR